MTAVGIAVHLQEIFQLICERMTGENEPRSLDVEILAISDWPLDSGVISPRFTVTGKGTDAKLRPQICSLYEGLIVLEEFQLKAVVVSNIKLVILCDVALIHDVGGMPDR